MTSDGLNGVNYTAKDAKVVILFVFREKPITSLCKSVFAQPAVSCKRIIKHVIIPESVIEICDFSSISEIRIEEAIKLKRIGVRAISDSHIVIRDDC